MSSVIFDDNDNTITLSSLTNGATAALVGSATVGVTLQTSSGAGVSGLATGLAWPLTMIAVAGATGSYRATLPHTLALTTGNTYTAVVTASGGAGLYATWKVPVRASTRTG